MMRALMLFVAVLLSGGCAPHRAEDGKRVPAAIVTPSSSTRGHVTSVNVGGRFVVLSYPVGTLPALESRLNVYRGGLKVAELKVTGPNRDTFTVADIIAGECRIGDEARED